MKRPEIWGLLTFVAALLILWQIDTMAEEMTRRPAGRVPTGQVYEGGGCTTPRYYLPGTTDPEPESTWVARHVESVAAFKADAAKRADEGE